MGVHVVKTKKQKKNHTHIHIITKKNPKKKKKTPHKRSIWNNILYKDVTQRSVINLTFPLRSLILCHFTHLINKHSYGKVGICQRGKRQNKYGSKYLIWP